MVNKQDIEYKPFRNWKLLREMYVGDKCIGWEISTNMNLILVPEIKSFNTVVHKDNLQLISANGGNAYRHPLKLILL